MVSEIHGLTEISRAELIAPSTGTFYAIGREVAPTGALGGRCPRTRLSPGRPLLLS